MDFHESIGTMVFTPTGRYIIGASDRENEEFQKKSKNIINLDQSKLKDSVELTCIQQMEITSENYNDILKVKGMPNHCFSDDYGLEVQKTIKSAVYTYCESEITDEELTQLFIDICKDMRVYQVQSGHTSGAIEKDNEKIIENVYEIFQKANVECMVDKCFKAGKDIADTQGGGEKLNWVYYDSDYYFQSQHLREMLQTVSTELAMEWEVEQIDYERVEKESKFTLNGSLDFNSVWNWRADQVGICSMSDFDWQPQEDFSFFYQSIKMKKFTGEITLDSQKGICIIKSSGEKWYVDVPFNNSVSLGELHDHFNVKDLFLAGERTKEQNLLGILEKFDVYTRFYGHNKAILES